MKSLRVFFSLLLVLSVLAGRSVSAAEISSPTLSYFQNGSTGIQWMLWRTGLPQPALFLETRQQPMSIYWDTPEKAVYYLVGQEIFRASVDYAHARSARVASLPANSDEVRALWRELGSGRLRIATMRAVEKKNVEMKGPIRYRLPDGTTIPGMLIPPWGLPFICSVLELSADGRSWKTLARLATKDLAGDTPGITVADHLRHELGVSHDRLLESYTCSAGQCREDIPASVIKRIEEHSGQKINQDEISMLSDTATISSVVFRTVSGDQLHIAPPVKLALPHGRVMDIPDIGDRKQLGLAINGGYLLLEDETDGARPIVIDLHGGVVVLKEKGWGAVWVPEARK